MTTLRQEQDLTRQVGEHISTLLFRLGWQQKDLATAIGMTPQTFGRKLKGTGDWSFAEVALIAATCYVTVQEMQDGLPSLSEWEARRDLYAIRDSNPEPAGLKHSSLTSANGSWWRSLAGLGLCWCPGDGRHHPSCPDRVTRADLMAVA